MTESTKKFIENHIDWIRNKEFEKIYSSPEPHVTREVTEVLYDLNMDPLSKLDYIPIDYLMESRLTEFIVPAHIKSIGDSAFFECYDLEKVRLPEGLEAIHNLAFCDCWKLSNINLPSTLTQIGSDAFAETSLKHVVIPDQVMKLPEYTFEECKKLETIKLGESVVTIGESCFGNCTSLRFVGLNNNLEKIRNYAFKGCTALESIYIPEQVTKIDTYAFYNCYPKIICHKSSTAHEFAKVHNLTFELI